MCNPSWQAGLLMGVSWPQQHGVQSNPHAPQPCRLLLCPLLKHLFSLPSRLPRLFLKLIVSFNWRIITLQYCDGFCHTPTWIRCRYTCIPSILTPLPPPSPPYPSGLSQSTGFECPASSIELALVICLHMVIYMSQGYSLISSHPHLLTHSWKVCSLHLCLFCCLAYRIIATIFLNSIYMH